MDVSLPAEPQTIAPNAASRSRLPLWNPRAATWWGVLLSPAFSAYIHMHNWSALGQEDKAAEARTWFRLMLGCIVFACLLGSIGDMIGRDLTLPASTGLALLLIWHIGCGRGQERYVAALTAGAYARRPWARTVLAAFGIFAALVVANAALLVFMGA